MSLEQLINRCSKKDVQAQSQLYQLYVSKLFALSLKYSRNYAEAQDNLQDAFVTIFTKINQYTHKGSFEGWMKRVTINTALQKYRGASVFEIIREEQIEDTSIDIDDDSIDMDYLLKCIQELPDRYRLVFNLYALDDYSHKEIAELLEISIGTSKSNLSRARVILKEKIESYKQSTKSQIL